MAFDPDAYLASKQTESFDPDAYLATKKTETTPPQNFQRKVFEGIPEKDQQIFQSMIESAHDPKRQAEVQRQVSAIERQKAEQQAAKGNVATFVETIPQVIGGAYAGIPGGTAGFTAGRQLTGALGLREQEPILTSAGTGLLTELGGRAIGKGLEAGLNLGSKVISKVTGKTAAEAAPTIGELKQAEDQAWGKVAESTATFKDPVPLKDSVDKLLTDKKFNYDPDTFPALNTAVKRLNNIYDLALKGAPADIHEMRTVRKLLQDVRMSGGAEAAEKKLAGEIMDKLDDYVIKHGGADAAAWKDARDITNQIYRSRDVQDIVKAAEKSSKATSKEIRSQFGDLLNSYQIKMYTPEQQAVIKQIADGTATEKTLEMIGSLAPKSVGWGNIKSLLGLGGAYGAAGVPGAVAAYMTGEASRGAANMLARQRVNMLDELIRGGKIPQTIELPQPIQRVLPAGVNVLANQAQRQ